MWSWVWSLIHLYKHDWLYYRKRGQNRRFCRHCGKMEVL